MHESLISSAFWKFAMQRRERLRRTRTGREGALDERKARVIELRLFGGLSVEETAAHLKVSVDTVMRDWKLAKAWLRRELERNEVGSLWR